MMKNAVRFELSNNQIFDHFHLHDITREEYMMMWVTPEDFMATKKEYVSIIRLMMKTVGEFPETDDCCPRGLEFKTKEGARQRKRTKQRACQAVLEEQEIQKDEGVTDPEFISEVYKEMAASSCLQALKRGFQDRNVVLALQDMEQRKGHEPQHTQQQQSPQTHIRPTRAKENMHVRRRSITENWNGNDRLPTRRIIVT